MRRKKLKTTVLLLEAITKKLILKALESYEDKALSQVAQKRDLEDTARFTHEDTWK